MKIDTQEHAKKRLEEQCHEKKLSRLAGSLKAEGTVLERLLPKHLVSDFMIRNYWRRLQRKPDLSKTLRKRKAA